MDTLPVDPRAADLHPSSPFVARYDRLRERLRELSSAPVRDMAAIDEVIVKLDEAHAEFKARHSAGTDHQRY